MATFFGLDSNNIHFPSYFNLATNPKYTQIFDFKNLLHNAHFRTFRAKAKPTWECVVKMQSSAERVYYSRKEMSHYNNGYIMYCLRVFFLFGIISRIITKELWFISKCQKSLNNTKGNFTTKNGKKKYIQKTFF